MEISNNEKEKSRLMQAAAMLMIFASLYFIVQSISTVKGYRFIGGGLPASNTISFDGKGEISAAPDLATVTFTIQENATLLKDAQDQATTKEKTALDFLDKNGIAKKDIKTESYSSYPKYDYGIPCYGGIMPCVQSTPKIIGYEVSETVSVKVHDLTKASVIVQGIGAIKVSSMTGPDFSIEKEDALKAEARKIAIDGAKAKAEVLSKDLGVTLVRIVNFSENGNFPIMYEAKGMMTADGASAPSPAPVLPAGQNKITSNVTITYEIR